MELDFRDIDVVFFLAAFTLLEAGSGPTRIDRIDVQCSGIEFYNVMHKNVRTSLL